jgi:hypothetical protein
LKLEPFGTTKFQIGQNQPKGSAHEVVYRACKIMVTSTLQPAVNNGRKAMAVFVGALLLSAPVGVALSVSYRASFAFEAWVFGSPYPPEELEFLQPLRIVAAILWTYVVCAVPVLITAGTIAWRTWKQGTFSFVYAAITAGVSMAVYMAVAAFAFTAASMRSLSPWSSRHAFVGSEWSDRLPGSRMMDRFLKDLVLIRKVTLEALHVLDGIVWQRSSGELHYQYKEMPNWIILAGEADLRAAHRAFVAIFEPHFSSMKDVNVTVSYTTADDTGAHQRAFFDTNEEVLAALTDPVFGAIR